LPFDPSDNHNVVVISTGAEKSLALDRCDLAGKRFLDRARCAMTGWLHDRNPSPDWWARPSVGGLVRWRRQRLIPTSFDLAQGKLGQCLPG
jgi:hypothetical protein